MAKDRLFFLVSFAFLGIIAAFLFRRVETPVVQTPAEKKEAPAIAHVAEAPNPEEFKQREVFALPPAPGMKAVPLELSARAGIAQFMAPGMYVDITFTSKSDLGLGTISLTLLRNVRVLAIGKDSNGRDYGKSENYYKSNTPTEVLLEMTPPQSEIFFFALTAGEVSLGLSDNNGHEEQRSDEENQLAHMLLNSRSAGNFRSILVTHMMRTLFPNVDVKITATSKGYIVSGIVPDPQIAGKILEILEKMAPGGRDFMVNLMEVEPQQVLISVKVLEVASGLRGNLGLNWKALFQNNGASVALGAVYPHPPPADPNYFFKMDGVQWGDLSLSAFVDMLEEDLDGRIIAEPNLTTISGQTAHFFAGGEFPILIPQGGTLLGTVTVEYKPYGVILDFTPFVDLNGLITLHVKPEVSNIDKQNSVVLNGFVIPSLVSRKADTMVKLWPGQSYVIAGLMLDELIERDDHLYCLNRLPLIGPLFSSKQYEDRRTELMIIITPYLVHSDRPCAPGILETDPCPEPCYSCNLYDRVNDTDPSYPLDRMTQWDGADLRSNYYESIRTCPCPFPDEDLIETYTQWE